MARSRNFPIKKSLPYPIKSRTGFEGEVGETRACPRLDRGAQPAGESVGESFPGTTTEGCSYYAR